MAQQPVLNGDSGLVARDKINENDSEVYGLIAAINATDVKVEWYEEIGSGTAGTLTKPTGSTILLDQWGGGVDVLASTSAGAGDLPLFETPVTAGGVPITATLNTGGDWTLSGTPSSYPIDLIYVYIIPIESLDEALALVTTEFGGKQDDVITTEGDMIVGDGSGKATRLPLGSNGQVPTSNGTTIVYTTPAGGGDVTAAANIDAGTLVVGDDGAKGVKDTGITVTATDTVYGANAEIVNKTAAYEFVSGDEGIDFTMDGEFDFTIPANASVAFPIGTIFNVANLGGDPVSFVLTSDTLLPAASPTGITTTATVKKVAATTWFIYGDLS